MSKLTPEQSKQLEQLKDITLPAPIDWWPLAMGWWILMALALVGLFTLLAIGWRKRYALRRAALAELATIERQKLANQALATALSSLLKRIALKQHGQSVAALSGVDWQQWLSANNHLPDNVAHFIANAPYQPHQEMALKSSEIFSAAKTWIHKNT